MRRECSELSESIFEKISSSKVRSGQSNPDYFRDADSLVRRAAAKAVGKLYRLGDDETKSAVIESLNKIITSPDPLLRQSAVFAAGEIADFEFEQFSKIFERAVYDKTSMVRNAAASVLGRLARKTSDALNFCMKIMQSPDPKVRIVAIKGLQNRGKDCPKDIIDALKYLSLDSSDVVQKQLVTTLCHLATNRKGFNFVYLEILNWQNPTILKMFERETVEMHEKHGKLCDITAEEIKEIIKNKGN